MKYMKFLIFIVVISNLGCAKKYIVPDERSNATLTISAAVDSRPGSVTYVQVFKNEKCDRTDYGNRLAVFTTRPIQGKGDPHSGVTIPIRSKDDFVFSFFYTDGSSGIATAACTVTLAFQPKFAEHYRTHFSTNGNRCAVKLNRVDNGVEIEMRPPLVRQIFPVCINALNG